MVIHAIAVPFFALIERLVRPSLGKFFSNSQPVANWRCGRREPQFGVDLVSHLLRQAILSVERELENATFPPLFFRCSPEFRESHHGECVGP